MLKMLTQSSISLIIIFAFISFTSEMISNAYFGIISWHYSNQLISLFRNSEVITGWENGKAFIVFKMQSGEIRNDSLNNFFVKTCFSLWFTNVSL